MIVDDDATVAVQDAAAGGQNRHGFDAVLLGALIVELRILNLQPPEAGNQEEKDEDRGVLKDGDLASRKASVIAQRGFVGNTLFEIWVDWRKGHKQCAEYAPT